MVNAESFRTQNGSGPLGSAGTRPPLDPGSAHGSVPPRSSEARATADPLKDVAAHWTEVREFLNHFLTAKADQVKLQARQVALWALAGVAGGIAGLAAIITAVVFLLDGTASGLAELLGGRLWAGQLIVGSAVLLGIGLAGWLGIRKFFQSSHKRMVAKYDRRHSLQRFTFGYDASRRAARERGADGGCPPRM